VKRHVSGRRSFLQDNTRTALEQFVPIATASHAAKAI
jgi:hypothetical protein